MRLMGLEAIYPKPHLSRNDAEHRIWPYLLRNVAIVRPNQVWSSDITYVPHATRLDVPDRGDGLVQPLRAFVAAVEHARRAVLPGSVGGGARARPPEVFNTDQGVQYTAHAFTDRLEPAGVAISMDGRGRWMDNVFVERLWRTLKYECIYLHDFATVRALEVGLAGVLRVLQRRAIARGVGLSDAGGGVPGGVRRRGTNSWRWSKSTRNFRATKLENFIIPIVRERLCGRARPWNGSRGPLAPPSNNSQSVV